MSQCIKVGVYIKLLESLASLHFHHYSFTLYHSKARIQYVYSSSLASVYVAREHKPNSELIWNYCHGHAHNLVQRSMEHTQVACTIRNFCVTSRSKDHIIIV